MLLGVVLHYKSSGGPSVFQRLLFPSFAGVYKESPWDNENLNEKLSFQPLHAGQRKKYDLDLQSEGCTFVG